MRLHLASDRACRARGCQSHGVEEVRRRTAARPSRPARSCEEARANTDFRVTLRKHTARARPRRRNPPLDRRAEARRAQRLARRRLRRGALRRRPPRRGRRRNGLGARRGVLPDRRRGRHRTNRALDRLASARERARCQRELRTPTHTVKREKCDIARARAPRAPRQPCDSPTSRRACLPRGGARRARTPVIDSCSSACVLLNPPGVLAREYQLSSRGDSPGSACERARHARHTCAQERASAPCFRVFSTRPRAMCSLSRAPGFRPRDRPAGRTSRTLCHALSRERDAGRACAARESAEKGELQFYTRDRFQNYIGAQAIRTVFTRW